MDKEQLSYLCECIGILTDLPVLLYSVDSDRIEFRHTTDYTIGGDENLENELQVKYLKDIFNSDNDSSIGYYISDDMLGFGIVKDKSSEYMVYLGPCKLSEISKKTAVRMYTDVTNTQDDGAIDKLYEYLQSLPLIMPETMIWLLSFINVAVNHEIFKPLSFFQGSPFFKSDKQVNDSIIKAHEFDGRNENGTIVDTAEKILLGYVKNGDIKSIKKYWSDKERMSLPIYTSSFYNANLLRDTKNKFIETVSVVARAAMEVDMSANTAHTLKDSYIARSENIVNRLDFVELYPAMYTDFAKQINLIRESSVGGNYIVNRAVNYIYEHITEKISAKEIADSLKVSSGYLSTVFKSTNGISIPEYIAMQKIKIAKDLLRATDKTLADISNYLSFSSQSYFQSQFKKVEGITPLEYKASLTSSPR